MQVVSYYIRIYNILQNYDLSLMLDPLQKLQHVLPTMSRFFVDKNRTVQCMYERVNLVGRKFLQTLKPFGCNWKNEIGNGRTATVQFQRVLQIKMLFVTVAAAAAAVAVAAT